MFGVQWGRWIRPWDRGGTFPKCRFAPAPDYAGDVIYIYDLRVFTALAPYTNQNDDLEYSTNIAQSRLNQYRPGDESASRSAIHVTDAVQSSVARVDAFPLDLFLGSHPQSSDSPDFRQLWYQQLRQRGSPHSFGMIGAL
jgi:hypothetical protein